MATRSRPRLDGTSTPFVDPTLQALDAPIFWLSQAATATLKATTTRTPSNSHADLDLPRITCILHIVIERRDVERLLIHTTDVAFGLVLDGDRSVDGPVNVRFHIDGMTQAAACGSLLMRLPRVLKIKPRHAIRSSRRNVLRNAMISVDGHRAGASYRDMAVVAYGQNRAASAWRSASRAMKDQMVRALSKGLGLVEGGYRRMLS